MYTFLKPLKLFKINETDNHNISMTEVLYTEFYQNLWSIENIDVKAELGS
jgi:hypothetical protein